MQRFKFKGNLIESSQPIPSSRSFSMLNWIRCLESVQRSDGLLSTSLHAFITSSIFWFKGTNCKPEVAWLFESIKIQNELYSPNNCILPLDSTGRRETPKYKYCMLLKAQKPLSLPASSSASKELELSHIFYLDQDLRNWVLFPLSHLGFFRQLLEFPKISWEEVMTGRSWYVASSCFSRCSLWNPLLLQTCLAASGF